MNKQKISKALTTLGLLFVIWLGVSYVYHTKNRGEVMTGQVAVPKRFEREFARVTPMRRAEKPVSTSFLSPEGDSTNWSDFKGEYLLVNFWATWCGPCVIELPSIDKLRAKLEGQNINVIAVSIDTKRSQDDIKEFLENRAIGKFAAYLDHNQEIQRKMSMRGIPTTYLIDPKGNIAYIFEGDANWSSPMAIRFFENILNSQNALN